MMWELLLLPLVPAVILLWLHMQTVKQWANAAVKRHCREMGVQFLDGTVVLSSIRLGRVPAGGIALKQRFAFEFSVTGERRYRGETVFLGKHQMSMQLEPHRFEVRE